MKASDTRTQVGGTKLKTTMLGYGGGGISNMYAPVSDKDALESVEAAWDAGIRLFDTAPFYGYGLAERRMGHVLGGKPRDTYLLSTKVGRLLVPRKDQPPHDFFPHSPMPFNPVYDYTYDGAMRSLEDSMTRLGVDRIDILLIHDIGAAQHGEDAHPDLFETCMNGAAKALAKMREEKVVGAIGLGVNEWQVCLQALERLDFDVFLLAGRYSLLEHEDVSESFLPKIEGTNAKLFIGGAFNSGILAAKNEDQQYYNYAKAPKEVVDKATELRSKCEGMSVSLGGAALRFPLGHPNVASVLFGARTAAEVKENVAAFGAGVPDGFWKEMGLAKYMA